MYEVYTGVSLRSAIFVTVSDSHGTYAELVVLRLIRSLTFVNVSRVENHHHGRPRVIFV